MATYVCSDIHGQYELYKRMLKKIHFNNDDHLYIIGDIIDRGPASMPIFKDIIKRKNVTCMMGNHEMMMIDHLEENYERDYWFNGNNKGQFTMQEFNKCSTKFKKQVVKYLYDMYLQIEVKIKDTTFLLSHSSFLAGRGTVKCSECPPEIMSEIVWNSPWRIWEYEPFETYKLDGRIHVIGHVPVQNIQPEDWEEPKPMPHAYINKEHNLINIDLGCARLGLGYFKDNECLCCMNLDKYVEGDEENAFTYILPTEQEYAKLEEQFAWRFQ